jgi:hypothetical protein
MRRASVDRVGHELPAAHLRVVEQARDARVAEAVRRGRGAFGDDQARGGALAVVLGHEGVGGIGFDRAAAGHGRHDETVAEASEREENGSNSIAFLSMENVSGGNATGAGPRDCNPAGECGFAGRCAPAWNRSSMTRQFDVVVERDSESWVVASVPALPGCHTQARSLDEFLVRVRDCELSRDELQTLL